MKPSIQQTLTYLHSLDKTPERDEAISILEIFMKYDSNKSQESFVVYMNRKRWL